MADEIKKEEEEKKKKEDEEKKKNEPETFELGGQKLTAQQLFETTRKLQSEYTKSTQSNKDLEKQLADIRAQVTQKPPEVIGKNLSDMFFENPEEAFNTAFTAKVGPVLNTVTNMLIESEKDKLRERDKDFDKYEGELDNLIQTIPQVVQQKGGIKNAYKMIKGYHYVEDNEKADSKRGTFIEGSSSAEDRGSKKEKLSQVEEKIRRSMGLTEEQWFENKKHTSQPMTLPED